MLQENACIEITIKVKMFQKLLQWCPGPCVLDVCEPSLTNHRSATRFLPSESLQKPSFHRDTKHSTQQHFDQT